MTKALFRIVGSIVVGWFGGAAVGILISRLVYEGRGEQLPIVTVPLGIIAVYALSFLVIKRGR